MSDNPSSVDHYYAVIMAGGGGTRLWPLSRQARPKQMIALFDQQTLFQMAVRRLDGLFRPENIYVVTVEQQAAELQSQCPDIPSVNFLLEPAGRGTASVIGLAASILHEKDPNAIMAVLASDHFIGNQGLFEHLLRAAWKASRAGYLVTLGIEPAFPATGFGYIQKGPCLGVFEDMAAYQVEKFIEKPGQTEAAALLAAGDHDWNSGMFVWQVGQILAEINQQMPVLANSLSEIRRDWYKPERREAVERIWLDLPNETIDFGIMENARNVVVLPAAGLQWNDVGSWDSMFDVLPADAGGNIVLGSDHLGLETSRSLIYSSGANRLVVTIGVEDLVVVDTGDVLLICRRDQAQQVRQVVNQLRGSKPEYL